MKKARQKVLLSLTSLLLAVSVFITGCTGAASTANSASSTAAAQSESAASAETAEPTEAASQYGGGSPWIDSNIKDNITEGMDISLKDDFHLAANYDWLLNSEIPEGYRSYSSFTVPYMQTLENSKALLAEQDLTGHNADLVYSFYNAFLDWDARDALGLSPIEPVVKDIEGISSIDELTAFITDIERSKYAPVLADAGNSADLNDSSSYITYVSGDGLLLGDSAEYTTRTSYGDGVYDADKTAFAALYTRLGHTQAEADELLDTAIEFEAKLSAGLMSTAELETPEAIAKLNNVFTPEELYSLCSAYPLRELIYVIGYDDAEQFIVEEPDYFKVLDSLYNADNLPGLKAHILVHYILGNITRLDKQAFDISLQRSNAIDGVNGLRPYEEYAYSAVKSFLTDPFAQLYIQKYDATETKHKITKICKEAIAYYKQMLGSVDWLSETTRAKAIEKLENITINSVYPDKWLDYSSLSLDGLSYYDTILAIADFSSELDRAHTNQKIDKELWDVDPLESNAYYMSSNNSIIILLGVLGGDIYNSDMSEAQIYGSIGTVIGHEISHAFDTNGAQYDKDGNLANWWTDEDYASFTSKADKLVAYYDAIVPYDGVQVSGTAVQSEAIADMAGLKCMLAIAESKEDFDYDAFFRSFAALWRRLNSPKFEYYILTQDVHPLDYLRTNVALQQYEKFYEIYDIQEGDGMYLAPENRIAVW